MGRSWLMVMLLISVVFSLSISQGDCRWIKLMVHYEREEYSNSQAPSLEENSNVGRGMMEMVMDYGNPEANTNHKGGAFNPPKGSSHRP
ncbi:hypothetical protein J5N97_007027 [Dioscorea zingiberensis]|uniref:Uncharacterized protein n=1 Tax=Dioscorea zingiberensis TaxID=325984 RepID=A0A9D5DB33_9LILI|nr:hypothetical protein J5N97_007027 [Dioscorea zingiberensis]